MTTSVFIVAHCDRKTEVFVNITDDDKKVCDFVLNDGQTSKCSVFGNRVMAVMERAKQENKET